MSESHDSGGVVSIERRRAKRTEADAMEENRALQALVEAESRARQRDNDVFDREIAEIRKRLDDQQARHTKLVNRVVVIATLFAAMVYILNWLGPTVVRKLINAMATGAP